MGKVFDIYFNFGIAGDCYLGRVLAGLDPNSDTFSILPPHFKDLSNACVEEGLCSLFDKLPQFTWSVLAWSFQCCLSRKLNHV